MFGYDPHPVGRIDVNSYDMCTVVAITGGEIDAPEPVGKWQDCR
jgi:hypothetical protein